MRGVKAHIHRANKKRTSESDIPDKFRVAKILKANFGIIALTDEIVQTPGGYASYRKPDLYSKDRRIAFELDGLIHGYGDEVSQREKDWRKLEDYKLIQLEHYVINSAVTNGYDKKLVITELIKQGLKSRKN